MKRILGSTVLSLVISALIIATVFAQDSIPSDDEVNAIAKNLFCPVCPNTPLDMCPTLACKAWREDIRNMLAEGKSEAQIRQSFMDYYGPRVLSEPPRTGFYWLTYAVPPIIIAAAAFMLFRALKTWKRSSLMEADLDEDDALTSDDEYITRMEEELKKRN
ncbi:MAG: cytochrome c-type biogenesis protein CcmH [Anaerolineae bacterium]|nr:cytochrome c-type biogenesis protein CcmH [Anaerolineae bacterium]MDK1081633.1 cytochrome c-type biogenesis protein CcmH [Anaerolineae bacterium]MDK1117949.1 cytochrome c-type biogenesis protein CcmH [Anaerolineae bacterium]